MIRRRPARWSGLGRLARAGLRVLALLTAAVVLLAGCAAGTVTDPGGRPGGVDPESGLEWVERAELPPEARETIALIEAGGPFPYRQDGSTFGNREGLLPQQPRGYYREYTVPTPGAGDRGARRIVTGDEDRIFYYTDDHYQSFRRVRP